MIRHAVALFALLLSGCAMVPNQIKVPDDTPLISYSRSVTGGETVKGSMARWGGIIVNVENKSQKTFVEVAHFPLNHYGKPVTNENTVGRFKARINGFVDPIMFEEGRTVTFVGRLDVPMSGMVGEQPYIYPTLAVDDFYIWRKESEYDVSTVYFSYGLGWYSPFYYTFHRPYWGIHHSRYRIIERRNRAPAVSTRPVLKRKSTTKSRPSPDTIRSRVEEREYKRSSMRNRRDEP
ncbi:Slp family lipoprotein [Alteromonas sp. ASW11-130]|uniref:Slp family lipoprotein n=1 Tax=Alteromonas sp. ASW11-130 TaxID=3015775 RepID=UPI002242C525|nr:Slp family lipoprotein [Alteromonas sp. ASW11-130]MCW8092544.1 Slp family lipoprotein [Alteromonas sp. ASW11-130]